MSASSEDVTGPGAGDTAPRTDPRKLALAMALVLSGTAACTQSDKVAVTSSKAVLKPMVEQATLKQQPGLRPAADDEKPIRTAEYGRNFENYAKNFENYAKNFENYAKNFENYAKNFENYGRNFENPVAGLRASDAYAAVSGPATLPNGAAVPDDVDQLLRSMAARTA
jgi:hypothetical protein